MQAGERRQEGSGACSGAPQGRNAGRCRRHDDPRPEGRR